MPDKGHSYTDPAYDAIEARIEARYDLPKGGMRDIRTKGERSNRDQVSSKGARTVYQITPTTRDLFLKAYGVDAYSSDEAAAQVAALHLRDSMRRNGGSWTGAVTEYIGGTDPANHGTQTAAYVKRVTGKGGPAPVTAPEVSDEYMLSGLTADQIMRIRPDQIGRGPAPIQKPLPKETAEDRRRRRMEALVGVPTVAAPVKVAGGSGAMLEDAQAAEAAGVKDQSWKDSQTFFDRAQAVVEEFISSKALEALLRPAYTDNPKFREDYLKNWQQIEDGYSDDERDQLRQAGSINELMHIHQTIDRERQRARVMDSSGHGTAWSIIGSLVDPAGWAAGFGIGKALEVGGIGAMALAKSGKTGRALLSSAAEGGVGNVALTGILDASGEHVTGKEYGESLGSGLVIGALMSPLSIRAGRKEAALEQHGEAMLVAEQTYRQSLRDRAVDLLGPNAPHEALEAEADRLNDADYHRVIQQALAPIPEHLKVLPIADEAGDAAGVGAHVRENWMTHDARVREDIEQRWHLDALHDPAERAMVAEQIARLERIDAANPVDQKAAKTALRHIGQDSTASRLHTSSSAAVRGMATILLESPSGASTRHPTASIVKAIRERVYMREVAKYDDDFAFFVRSQEGGHGPVLDNLTGGKLRKQFDRRVRAEVEARANTPDGVTFDPHPAVVTAANRWERGMNMMRIDQQHTNTVGSGGLGMTSRGYVTRLLDPSAVASLSADERREAIAELARQVGLTYGWDAQFSRRWATKHLERSEKQIAGSYDVPNNLWSHDAADGVRETLEAMNLPPEDVDRVIGKMSRGGANHTKGRLDLDLSADIGNGKKLSDLYVDDMLGLYRRYAARTSGEVALAQYGIMGRNGLKVLRSALEATLPPAERAHTLKAFDQIAAEMLNTPFGGWNHKAFDNARLITSMARLGGMTFTQAAESGNGIVALGVQRVMATSKDMPRLMKEVHILANGGEVKDSILKSLDLLNGGQGMDGYYLVRAWDNPDAGIQMYATEQVDVVSRALRAGAHLQSSVTLHRMVTAGQTRGMSEQIIRKAFDFIRKGINDVHLDDMGIDADLRAKLRADMDNIATFDSRGRLQELDLQRSTMSGYDVKRLVTSIERGASQIIQRNYIGETGVWAHNGFLKWLFQFRTFPIVAMEKQWGRSMKINGAQAAVPMAAIKSVAALSTSTAFGLPIYLARTAANAAGMSDAERDEYLDTNLSLPAIVRATAQYASDAGIAPDLFDVGMGFASSFGDAGDSALEAVGSRGQSGRSPFQIVPGAGMVEDLWSGTHSLDTAKGREKMLRLLPGAAHPAVRPIINAMTAD